MAKVRYAEGDMVSFACFGKRLLGEVCTVDRVSGRDATSYYDIKVCADLYCAGEDPCGCLFKHIPEADIEGRVGGKVPLEAGMRARYARWADGRFVQRIGWVERLDGGKAVLRFDEGRDAEVDEPEANLEPLVTRWEEDDGAGFHLDQYTGRIERGFDGRWTAVGDMQGDSLGDVWPGADDLRPGMELEVLAGGSWVHAWLVERLDGELGVDGLGPLVRFEGLQVRPPFLVALPFQPGGTRSWDRWYAKPAKPFLPDADGMDIEHLPKLGDAVIIARNRVTGLTEALAPSQIYGYEGEECGVFAKGRSGRSVKIVDNHLGVNPFLDIRVVADPGLPYALYMNGRLIGRAAEPAVMPLGDIPAYVDLGDPDVVDEFVMVDTRTGKVVERANSRFDVWDPEADTFVLPEEHTGRDGDGE